MKETLKQIIRTFHGKKPLKLNEREMKLPVNSGKIVSVIGTRRCGKTYLLYSVTEQLLLQKMPKTKMLYLNLEDERLELKTQELDLILQAYRELYPE
jgi:uncharacterized protein